MNQRKLAVIELTPTDDAFIASFKPDVPIGDLGWIYLNGTGAWWECSLYTQKHVCLYYGCEWHEDEGFCNGKMHPSDTEGYLKFELPDIPSGWHVVKATLSIFGIQRLMGSTVRIYRCYATDWSEDEITWNNFNPLCDEIPDDTQGWEFGYVDFDLTRSITACLNEGERYAAFKMTETHNTSWATKEWPDREPYLTITLEKEVLPEICTWIDAKGGPTGLTIADIFEIIDSYIFQTPPAGTLPDAWLGISSAELDSHSGDQYDYRLADALDGATKWIYHRNQLHWFVLDLGQTCTIKKVRGRSNEEEDPIDVNIYIDDNNPPTTLCKEGITNWRGTSSWQEITLTTEGTGRYIKVEIENTEHTERYLDFGDARPNSFTIFDAYGITGYTFIPTLNNIFGVIDYFLGFNGDPLTGCRYYGG